MPSGIEIDAAEALATTDRLIDGSVVSFFRTVTRALEPLADRAKGLWPVRSGKSRDSIEVQTGTESTGIWGAIAGGKTGNGRGAHLIKFSAVSRQRRQQMISNAKSPSAAQNVRRYIKRQFGATPPDDLVGRQPWRWLVERPAKASAVEVARVLQDDLTRLAGGS